MCVNSYMLLLLNIGLLSKGFFIISRAQSVMASLFMHLLILLLLVTLMLIGLLLQMVVRVPMATTLFLAQTWFLGLLANKEWCLDLVLNQSTGVLPMPLLNWFGLSNYFLSCNLHFHSHVFCSITILVLMTWLTIPYACSDQTYWNRLPLCTWSHCQSCFVASIHSFKGSTCWYHDQTTLCSSVLESSNRADCSSQPHQLVGGC